MSRKSLLVAVLVGALVGWCGWIVAKSVGVWSDALAEDEPISATDCQCSGVRLCTGPRGGRFCIDDSGNKRYKQRLS